MTASRDGRRTRGVLALWGAVVALVLGLPGTALAASEPTLEVTAVDASGAPDVRLTVTAPAAVVGADLPAEAFTVREGGEGRSARVTHLAGTELQVVLLVDASGSMAGEPLEAVKEAALSFLDRMPAGAVVSVLGFATRPQEASAFGTDLDEARSAVRALEADGRTATYDAVLRALAQFDGLDGGRRFVVLLSDGEDNESSTPLEEARGALAAADVTLHVVELETRFSDAQALRALAEAGGGEVVSLDDPAALTAAYDGIAAKLLDQYLVEYRSEAAGETHVEVGVAHGDVEAAASVVVALPEAASAATPTPTPSTTPTPAPAAAPPAPRPTPVEPPSGVAAWLAGAWGLGTGVVLVYVGLVLAILLLLRPRPARSTLDGAAWARRGGAGRQGGLATVGTWAEERIERGLQRRGLTQRVNGRLEQAGILLKPSEAVVVAVAGSLAALALGFVVHGLLLGIALAGVTALGMRMYLDVRITRRRAAFSEQLADTLQLLSGSLRAGYGLLQAVDSVAREAQSPTAEEFRRLVVETRLGRDLAEALRAMGERMGSDDFTWVVQAIDIHREVGGDLSEVLDRVAETIRAREQIGRQVKALSAEGRLSAKVLIGLPVVVMGAMAVINPGYLDELTGSGAGRLMLAMAGLLITAGSIWIHRLVRIEF